MSTDSFYSYHGIVLWVSWTLVGLLQLYTNRYWKHLWRWRQTLHTVAGTLSTLLTIIFGFMALGRVNWEIRKGKHTISGFITLLVTILLMLCGFFSSYVLTAKSN